MGDLIDRELLKSELIKKWNVSDDHDFANKDVWKVVEGLPSAEPKKGHWIGISDGYADGYPVYDEWECSCCGVIEEDEEPTWNYCPNCGAKMVVDDD